MNPYHEVLLTTAQVASWLTMNADHLRSARARGALAIPFIRIGRAIRYRPVDVQAFIEANRKEVSK